MTINLNETKKQIFLKLGQAKFSRSQTKPTRGRKNIKVFFSNERANFVSESFNYYWLLMIGIIIRDEWKENFEVEEQARLK